MNKRDAGTILACLILSIMLVNKIGMGFEDVILLIVTALICVGAIFWYDYVNGEGR